VFTERGTPDIGQQCADWLKENSRFRPLSYGDVVFLSGDFFAGPKNEGDYMNPSGEQFLIRDLDQVYKDLFPKVNHGFHTVSKSTEELVTYVGDLAKKHGKYSRGIVSNTFRQKKYKRLHPQYVPNAFDNFDHFHPFAPAEYRRIHTKALKVAYLAGKRVQERGPANAWPNRWETWVELFPALIWEGIAAHYLTDCFAAGHVRVPRTQLVGVCNHELNAAFLARLMHDEDGRYGVPLQFEEPYTAKYGTWMAYGDGDIFKDRSAQNRENALMSTVKGLESIFQAFLDGYAGVDFENVLEADSIPIPRVAETNDRPLFKLQRLSSGSVHGLQVRMERPDGFAYRVLRENCGQLGNKCMTCAALRGAKEKVLALYWRGRAPKRENSVKGLNSTSSVEYEWGPLDYDDPFAQNMFELMQEYKV